MKWLLTMWGSVSIWWGLVFVFIIYKSMRFRIWWGLIFVCIIYNSMRLRIWWGLVFVCVIYNCMRYLVRLRYWRLKNSKYIYSVPKKLAYNDKKKYSCWFRGQLKMYLTLGTYVSNTKKPVNIQFLWQKWAKSSKLTTTAKLWPQTFVGKGTLRHNFDNFFVERNK